MSIPRNGERTRPGSLAHVIHGQSYWDSYWWTSQKSDEVIDNQWNCRISRNFRIVPDDTSPTFTTFYLMQLETISSWSQIYPLKNVIPINVSHPCWQPPFTEKHNTITYLLYPCRNFWNFWLKFLLYNQEVHRKLQNVLQKFQQGCRNTPHPPFVPAPSNEPIPAWYFLEFSLGIFFRSLFFLGLTWTLTEVYSVWIRIIR